VRLRHRQWRHHGQGVLQAQVDGAFRIHIWDPRLVFSWYLEDPMRQVHSHRSHLTSAVLVGSIIDETWRAVELPAHLRPVDDIIETDCWTMVHPVKNSGQSHPLDSKPKAQHLGRVFAWRLRSETHEAGRIYVVPQGAFHCTKISELTVTLIHRQSYNDSAFVLGSRDTDVTEVRSNLPKELYTEIILEAEQRTKEIDL